MPAIDDAKSEALILGASRMNAMSDELTEEVKRLEKSRKAIKEAAFNEEKNLLHLRQEYERV